MLDLQLPTYMKDGLTEASGARVAVHEAGVEILPGEYGMNVMPNQKTSLSLRNKV